MEDFHRSFDDTLHFEKEINVPACDVRACEAEEEHPGDITFLTEVLCQFLIPSGAEEAVGACVLVAVKDFFSDSFIEE